VKSREAFATALRAFGCLPLLASGEAAAAASLATLLSHEAPISAEEPGLVRLVLPPEVIRACRPDLSDLRVFDAGEREVAFLVESLRLDEVVEVTQTFDPQTRSLRREVAPPERGPALTRESYEIAPPASSPESGAWDLVFDSAQARFVREVTIRSVGSGGGEPLAAGEPLFRLDAYTQRVRIPLPPLGPEALEVEIAGREGFYLEPRFRFESGRRLGSVAPDSVALEEIGREQGDGKTVVLLARPTGIVPALLRVETRTGTLRRAALVFDEQPGSAGAPIGGGPLYRVGGREGASNLMLNLRPARGATLRVEIEDGDSPPLDDLRFFAVIRRPVLVFELPADPQGAVAGTLRFGGGRVRLARYDLDAFAPPARSASGEQAEALSLLYDPSFVPLARIGEIRANPRFDSAPALAFAMHAGAALDPRAFSHRRPIEIAPSPEGLSRLELAPEDAALLRPDLGDLRVVDAEERQWPYLLGADDRGRDVALAVTEAPPKHRQSRYALAFPSAPLRVERLVLRSSAPFFDRGYELRGEDEHGSARSVAKGRLVKRALHPGPVEIELDAQPVHALELLVDDGDDAPLRFDAVTARVRLPELFLVAPPGSYALLLGNPDLPAPRYELERVRDVVLAASSNPAAPGRLGPNPEYSLGARLRGEDGAGGLLQIGLVWGVLLLAVAVLAVLTLRVARQAPPRAEAGEDSGES